MATFNEKLIAQMQLKQPTAAQQYLPQAFASQPLVPQRERIPFPDNAFGTTTDIGPSRLNRSYQVGAQGLNPEDAFN